MIKPIKNSKTYIIIALIIGTCFFKPLYSQIGVTIPNLQICNNSYNYVPVIISNFIDIDSFCIEIKYNNDIVKNTSYYGLHQALNEGNANITINENITTIKWHTEHAGAIIINDTLLHLNFFANSIGSTELQIIESSCYFYSSDGSLQTFMANNGTLNVNGKPKVFLTEINATCMNKCEANYLASVYDGHAPYQILWNGSPGRFDSIQTGLCAGPNSLWIKDKIGCVTDTIFEVSGLPSANVEIEIRCYDTLTEVIYLQNPTLDFSFKEIPPSHVLEPPLWEFGDGDTAKAFTTSHKYIGAKDNTDGYYILKVHFINENGCDTVIEKIIEIHEAKLRIPNILIKNADNESHAAFIISDREGSSTVASGNYIYNQVIRMEVVIRDRWGRKVFASNDYKNDWKAENVTDGVYFYTLKVIGHYKNDFFKGSVTVFTNSL